MATKIRRSLFIGLGGTGMNSLLHAKKMFIDTYGELPPMIGLLGIDTDGGAYTKELISARGEKIKLDPDEQMPIHVPNPRDIYKQNTESFSWVPEENIYSLTSMTEGAGAIRSNGRFAFTFNVDALTTKLNTKVNDITNATIKDNAKYALLDNKVEIHIVFSICGGTGAGTFINMAYLCKQLFNFKVVGYAVLPEVFESFLNVGIERIRPNAYASLTDLDYLMGIDSRQAFGLQYLRNDQTVESRPFDAIFLINNKNKFNDTYDHVDKITEMISLALVTSSGELSTASASTIDNLSKNISQGLMDINDKRAWVSGLGVSEIIYSSKELAEIYSLKAAKAYISELFNSNIDEDNEASTWIDSPEVNIRENNNCDFVIDFMLRKTPVALKNQIADKKNAKPECDEYIQRNSDSIDLSDKIQEKSKKVDDQLHALVVNQINKTGGITGAAKVIKAIQNQVNIFMGEMTDELADWQKKVSVNDSILKTNIQILTEHAGSIRYTLFGNLKEDETAVVEAVNALVIAKREVKRRQAAITFYNGLKNKLQGELETVGQIEQIARNVQDGLTARIANVENLVGKNTQIFQIDLTTDTHVTVNRADIMADQFIASIGLREKLYSLATSPKEAFESILLEYTNGLNGTKAYAHTTIDDVINQMPEEAFQRLMKKALDKSEVLLQTNYRGHIPDQSAADCFYIGVPNKKYNRMAKDNALKNMMTAFSGNLDFANLGMDNRIIFYHQLGVMPVFAVASVPAYEEKYELSTVRIDAHFDKKLETRMEREEYSIYPKVEEDDSMTLWVSCFLLGYIKKEEGKYLIKNKEKGEAISGYWYDLGAYRDDAFNSFKQDLRTYRKDIQENLEEFQKTNGSDAYNNILKDAQTEGVYLQKYSLVGFTLEQLHERANSSIKNLMNKEIETLSSLPTV